MLTLKNIHKDYTAGDQTVTALHDVSVSFRKNEFVCILGPSGCGKTTLLNIIGGLDGYTSGDLIIGGKSTKEFESIDWDAYRNHSVGFVFQSYNLIPHQTVLANVELALTISGIPKAERKRRAKEALKNVGLEKECNKRPSQMSGGQMQRVAIARALVNNPEILLADEPTGALDSETSIQIMEMLKEVAKDRLVIMVTHNPDLAAQYATRTIRILDGEIMDDTNPYTEEKTEKKILTKKEKGKEKKEKRLKNRSMSYGTALSLSMNNLRTKKGRTFLTSFAGSIGIIGIALILAISNGVTGFIARVQEDTLSSYPIVIQAESADMAGMVMTMMNANNAASNITHEKDGVYSNRVMYDLLNSMAQLDVQKNNLTAFKQYLDANRENHSCISAVNYVYDMDFHIFTEDKEGRVVKTDTTELMMDLLRYPTDSGYGDYYNQMATGMFESYDIWEEMLAGEDGELISPLFHEQYDLIYGSYPQNYNEMVLIVDKNNEVSDLVSYSLGFKTKEEVEQDLKASMTGTNDNAPLEKWTYEDVVGKTFKLILPADFYQQSKDGTYINVADTDTGLSFLYNSDKPIELKITGIIRPNNSAMSSMMTGSIGYTSALTEHVIHATEENPLVKKQLADPTVDVLTGLPFANGTEDNMTPAEKAEAVKAYFASLPTDAKAEIYTEIQSVIDPVMLETQAEAYLANYTADQLKKAVIDLYAEQMGITDTADVVKYVENMEEGTLRRQVKESLKKAISAEYAKTVQEKLAMLPTEAKAAMFDAMTFTETQYVQLYNAYMPATHSKSTYDKTMQTLGYINEESPSAVRIFARSFEEKDEISDLIAAYNDSVPEEDKLNYTDYVKMLMNSVTIVIKAISYVLIAFVGVSLVVSSIMIGVITYISVLERTKEIGILRAIGASKKDVSRVFNAETMIVGLISGALGIGVTLLLTLIANPILHKLTEISTLNAVLPVGGAVILVILSVLLTLIAGLIPSHMAAKKDPVEALRTE